MGFAINGMRAAFKHESSVRMLVVAAASIFLFLAFADVSAIWWALVILTSAAVFTAELFNTAIENLADAVHPEQHPLIGRAKDCASGAVLLISFASLLVFAALLFHLYLR